MTIFRFPVRAALALAVVTVSAGAAAAPGQSGMAVVRDPQTGQMRPPTAAELRALQQSDSSLRQLRQAPAARPPVVRPDGVRAAALGERGMVYSIVQRGADGKLTQLCVEGETAATHAAHGEGSAGKAAVKGERNEQ